MAEPYHGGIETRQSSPQPFSLGRISIGLGNRDRSGRVALADVEVTAGAFRFTGYVLPCGTVTLPPILADEAVAVAIGKAARQATLAALAERWQDREEAVAGQLRAGGCGGGSGAATAAGRGSGGVGG